MAEKLWGGRFAKSTDKLVEDFHSSISFDQILYKQDIQGSLAHAKMLGHQGIISPGEAEQIIDGLTQILADIEAGRVEFEVGAEDIHMNIEKLLTERIGDAGKKLHTARSRNDQVAVDIRLYIKDQIDEICGLILALQTTLLELADQHKTSVMAGYTHLQKAQPITMGHHLLAYFQMFRRDFERLQDCRKRADVMPLGSGALATTTFPIDREFTAEQLGFAAICENSLDGVSDRDFIVEFISAAALIMVHLSRFSEEIVLWSSTEFGYITLDDGYSTGSSIMPQKKNSDMAELVRGKTGRVYGDLIALLTMLKGLPLAYNKDMQEDKENVFDTFDTLSMCLDVFTPMVEGMKVLKENMKLAAQKGFINATDLADYLVKKGMPFRTAYKISGTIVAECIKRRCVLENLSIDEYKNYSELFEEDIYREISLETCVAKRISLGGTSLDSCNKQIEFVESELCK